MNFYLTLKINKVKLLYGTNVYGQCILILVFTIDPCSEYQLLNDSSRLLTNRKTFPVLSDQDTITSDWYRLTSNLHENLMIPTYCTSPFKCQTLSTGWINGSHPTGN